MYNELNTPEKWLLTNVNSGRLVWKGHWTDFLTSCIRGQGPSYLTGHRERVEVCTVSCLPRKGRKFSSMNFFSFWSGLIFSQLLADLLLSLAVKEERPPVQLLPLTLGTVLLCHLTGLPFPRGLTWEDKAWRKGLNDFFFSKSLMDVTAIIPFIMQKREINDRAPGTLYSTKVMTSLSNEVLVGKDSSRCFSLRRGEQFDTFQTPWTLTFVSRHGSCSSFFLLLLFFLLVLLSPFLLPLLHLHLQVSIDLFYF